MLVKFNWAGDWNLVGSYHRKDKCEEQSEKEDKGQFTHLLKNQLMNGEVNEISEEKWTGGGLREWRWGGDLLIKQKSIEKVEMNLTR